MDTFDKIINGVLTACLAAAVSLFFASLLIGCGFKDVHAEHQYTPELQATLETRIEALLGVSSKHFEWGVKFYAYSDLAQLTNFCTSPLYLL